MTVRSAIRIEAPRFLLFSASGIVAGLSYRALKDNLPGSYLNAALTGVAITLGLYLARLGLERTRPGRWLQRLPFYVATLVELAVYFAVVIVALDVVGHLIEGYN